MPVPARTVDNVEKAVASIELREDKLLQSMFWFINVSSIDEIALSNLKGSNITKATQTWLKLTDNKAISERNFSAVHNLSTLKLLSDNLGTVAEGIYVKLQLIDSPHWGSYVKNVVDNDFQSNSLDFKTTFLKFCLSKLTKTYSPENIVKYFSKFEWEDRQYIGEQLASESIYQLERLQKVYNKERVNNARIANNIASKYADSVSALLKKIKYLIGDDHPRVKSLSDDIAELIHQCDIDYFNSWNEERSVTRESIDILSLAISFAESPRLRSKLESDKEDMQQRLEEERTAKYFENFSNALVEFSDGPRTAATAVRMLNKLKPILSNLSNDLGSKRSEYIELSNIVVTAALQFCIEDVNSAQQGNSIPNFISIASTAMKAMVIMKPMEMTPETRKKFIENFSVLEDIHHNAQAHLRQVNEQKNKNEGCYIATMAYGDYDHPQVLKLRQFRDEILQKSYIGRMTIKVYYSTSPSLVKILKGFDGVNKIVRIALDKLITKLDI
jgi:hypothetical protein